MPHTLDQFLQQYGRPNGTYPVIEVGDSIQQWPTVVVRFGDRAAVIEFCGVRSDAAHFSIDIRAFVDGVIARAGVFGMEDGRYEVFNETAPGTSHGWPAVRGITVLIGQQAARPPVPPEDLPLTPPRRAHRGAETLGTSPPSAAARPPSRTRASGHG